MNKPTRWFRIFERRVDHGWEITKRDPWPMLLAFVLVFLLAGCSDTVSNEYIISESASCEANGFDYRIVRSQYDGDVIGVECMKIHEFKPTINEFTLDDGTRCIAVTTRPTNFPKSSGLNGIACDWENK